MLNHDAMDLTPPPTATTTTVAAQTIATATTNAAQTIATATTNAVNAISRMGQRNGTHRAVNVHGRLMYDEIVINDVWINAILSTLAFSCAACVCLCFLYCKFQQWKNAAQLRRDEKNSQNFDNESLPSYTIVTGLPTYEEAVERMKNPATAEAPCKPANVAAKSSTVTVVQVKNERTGTTSCKPALTDAAKKFGLVSRSVIAAHDDGCSHCLSVQELLETYNVR